MKRFSSGGGDGREGDRLAVGIADLVERFDHRAAVPNHQQAVTGGVGVTRVGAIEEFLEIGNPIAVGVAGGGFAKAAKMSRFP